jgi:hypothetical protein
VNSGNENPTQHALAADGSTGREKSRVQSRFPRKPAQKSRIIDAFLAPAMLGAPEALAVGRHNDTIEKR